mgnify:CR=1 FL=1
MVDVQPDGETYQYGEEITFSAAVENTGQGADTQTITLEVVGFDLDQTELELDAQEERTIMFTHDASTFSPMDMGHSFTFHSDDDEIDGLFYVEES